MDAEEKRKVVEAVSKAKTKLISGLREPDEEGDVSPSLVSL